MASSTSDNDSKSSQDFLEFMVAGGVSKTVASCIAYPHGMYKLFLFFWYFNEWISEMVLSLDQ